MRVTLLFFFTYYSLRARLLQIPGQQHGSGQGGQRRGLAAQDARAKAHRHGTCGLGGGGLLDREAALTAGDDGDALILPGCSTSRRGAPPPS